MDETIIGTTAGMVWGYLRENDGRKIALSDLKKLRGVKPDDVLAAIGWLAREGKIQFHNDQRKISLSLSEHELAAT